MVESVHGRLKKQAMKHVIHTIPVKMTNCYLIRGDDGWALLESGAGASILATGSRFRRKNILPFEKIVPYDSLYRRSR